MKRRISSQSRLAANRRNAARSTGPITVAGKSRAKLNARRHGLSVSIRHQPGFPPKISDLAMAIAGEDFTWRQLKAARGVAEAQLELWRVQDFRRALIETETTRATAKRAEPKGDQVDETEFSVPATARAILRALPAVTKLERYERRAWSQYRRAVSIYALVAEQR